MGDDPHPGGYWEDGITPGLTNSPVSRGCSSFSGSLGEPPPSPNSPKKKQGGNGVNKVDFLITRVFFKHFMKLRVKITDPLKEFVSCNYRHKIIK